MSSHPAYSSLGHDYSPALLISSLVFCILSLVGSTLMYFIFRSIGRPFLFFYWTGAFLALSYIFPVASGIFIQANSNDMLPAHFCLLYLVSRFFGVATSVMFINVAVMLWLVVVLSPQKFKVSLAHLMILFSLALACIDGIVAYSVESNWHVNNYSYIAFALNGITAVISLPILIHVAYSFLRMSEYKLKMLSQSPFAFPFLCRVAIFVIAIFLHATAKIVYDVIAGFPAIDMYHEKARNFIQRNFPVCFTGLIMFCVFVTCEEVINLFSTWAYKVFWCKRKGGSGKLNNSDSFVSRKSSGQPNDLSLMADGLNNRGSPSNLSNTVFSPHLRTVPSSSGGISPTLQVDMLPRPS